MNKLLLIILLISATSVGAAHMSVVKTANNPLLLKDGSYLIIEDDETMRMVDKNGNPFEMNDGVEMELKDGTLIIMKNKIIMQHDHGEMKMKM